jgi:hypothetical protein
MIIGFVLLTGAANPPKIMVDATAAFISQETWDAEVMEWGQPGDQFLIEGTLYPFGTLDRETGLPVDPGEEPIGKWSCRGVMSSHSYDFLYQRFYLYGRGEIYGMGTEMLGWENDNILAVIGGTGDFVGALGEYTLNMPKYGVFMAEFKFFMDRGHHIDFANLPEPYFPETVTE